jgi:hypothetical protein
VNRPLLTVAVTALLMAAGTAVADAQSPAGDGGGGLEVGGSVPSLLGLSLTQPIGLGEFANSTRVHVSTTTFLAAVTATDPAAQLSVSMAGAPSGPRRGHLASGSSVLPLPLELAVGSGPFESLGVPGVSLLERWNSPIADQKTVIALRQRTDGPLAVSGPYRAVLVITASTQVP